VRVKPCRAKSAAVDFYADEHGLIRKKRMIFLSGPDITDGAKWTISLKSFSGPSVSVPFRVNPRVFKTASIFYFKALALIHSCKNLRLTSAGALIVPFY